MTKHYISIGNYKLVLNAVTEMQAAMVGLQKFIEKLNADVETYEDDSYTEVARLPLDIRISERGFAHRDSDVMYDTGETLKQIILSRGCEECK